VLEKCPFLPRFFLKNENVSINITNGNMPSIEDLKKLQVHKMQLERTDTKKEGDDDFECPVCYTDGTEFGIAIPKCGHKICLSCYSNILLRGGDKTLCPCCRTPYCKPTVEIAEEDPYSGMPPLVTAPPLNLAQYVMLSRLTLPDYLHGDHLMTLINDMTVLANSLDNLIEPPEQQTMN